ncbi:efflux RND transporter periplasmic adaptor subunit [Calothrix sp. CCY 0018]|uniref:efflux RND transporter periplasmic adaptor subunit n=1 Tax=Calothrix sp. CCY 0018 TaxID=3103864 RepID=UPI0039C75663
MTAGDSNFSDIPAEEEAAIEETTFKDYPETSKQRPWWTIMLMGVVLGVGITMGGMRLLSNRPKSEAKVANTPTTEVAPAMTVTLALVELTKVARNLNVTGTVGASELTPVLPQSNGLQIKQILVQQGDSVKESQVMAILDDSLLQDQILQAKAEVESQEAEVASRVADLASKQAALESSKANVISNQATVQQRQADLAQAQAKLREATRNYQRNKQLSDRGAISKQLFETAETNFETAKEAVRIAQANIRSAIANVSSAEANISSAEAGVSSAIAKINSAKAGVKSATARVQQLKTQLGQTVVRAPVSGIVAEKLARVGDITGVPPQTQVGNVVGGTQKLFSIIRQGNLELQAKVPTVQLSQIKVLAPAQITTDADNRVKLRGKVKEIEPVVNQQRREATVKIDLPATNLLKPGMFARAAILTDTNMAVAIPQKAVLPQPDGSAIVFTIDPDKIATSKKVETGEILKGGKIEIKSGLQPGKSVIVDGAGYLKDGDKVRIAKQ